MAENGGVDVVFTNHRMPGSLTGAQLASKVSDRYPDIRVVVTSAFYDGIEWNGLVLPKPCDLDATVAMLVATAKEERGEV